MDIYVAPNGNDASDGSPERPVATLVAARNALRAAAPPEKRILVRAGKYYSVSLYLGPEDSGLMLEAAPGEQPLLHGGRLVTDWQPDGDRFVSAPLDGVKEEHWDFRTLIVNGRLAPRARLPATGMLRHESVFDARWMSTTAGGWDRKPTDRELTTMQYRAGDLGPWLDIRNAEVTVFHQWDESLVGVQHHDPATRTLTFSSPCGHPPGAFAAWTKKGTWYTVWNVREGMHEPGQWYLDRTRGRVVYWPRPGESTDDLEIVAPSTLTILQVAGQDGNPVRNVSVSGLSLSATTTRLEAAGFGATKLDAAVSIGPGAEDIALTGLTLRNVGGQGIRIGGSKVAPCRRVTVRSCIIETCGGPGLLARGEATEVTDTIVRHVGLVYPSALAMSVAGTDCVVSHNEVSHCPYTAIHGGGKRLRIENNLMHDFMQQLDDGAAIYVFGGNQVVYRGNVVQGTSGREASAYYLDEQCEDCLVEGNLAVNTAWPSHNHMARACTIRGNLFVDDGPCKITLPKSHGFTFERNVVVSGGDITVQMSPDGWTTMPSNIFFSKTGSVKVAWQEPDSYGGRKPEALPMRDGSVVADPLFVAPEKGDYAFRSGSPAEKLGIAPRDFTEAGPRERGGRGQGDQ